MFGATWQFGGEVGADHLVKNNLFMGTTDGDACGDKIASGGCPATTMLRFGGVWGTRLRVEDNLMVGHTFGAWIARGCDDAFEWRRNVAMSNFVGWYIFNGCAELELDAFKNTVSVAASGADEVSNFLSVEAAVGFVALAEPVKIAPTQKCEEVLLAGQTRVLRDATIIGRLPQLARVGFEFSCYRRNNMWWGKKEAMRPLDQVEYAGVQLGNGTGSVVYGGLVPGWYFEIENVAFVNFGHGLRAPRQPRRSRTRPRASSRRPTRSRASRGFATCYLAHFSKLRFVDARRVRAPHAARRRGVAWDQHARGGADPGHAAAAHRR